MEEYRGLCRWEDNINMDLKELDGVRLEQISLESPQAP